MSDKTPRERFVEAMRAIAEGLGSFYCTECGNSGRLVQAASDAFADQESFGTCFSEQTRERNRASLRKEIGI